MVDGVAGDGTGGCEEAIVCFDDLPPLPLVDIDMLGAKRGAIN